MRRPIRSAAIVAGVSLALGLSGCNPSEPGAASKSAKSPIDPDESAKVGAPPVKDMKPAESPPASKVGNDPTPPSSESKAPGADAMPALNPPAGSAPK